MDKYQDIIGKLEEAKRHLENITDEELQAMSDMDKEEFKKILHKTEDKLIELEKATNPRP